MSIKLNRLVDLTDQFEIFVFDLCGVVHNGVSLYKDSLGFIQSVIKAGKKAVFLSNSPSSSKKSYEYLAEQGLDYINLDNFVTSGDFFIHSCKSDPKLINKNFYFFGVERNKNFLIENYLNLVNSHSDADYIICSFFSSDKHETEKVVDETRKLASDTSLPLICSNPDIRAPHGGEMRYTPGYFAKIYEEAGGEVLYFGKPYKEIYEYLFKKINLPDNISKDKILMIGDSLHTDVRGAKNTGIRSLLVGKGYHRDVDFSDRNALDRLFLEYGFQPDFYIEGLK